MLHPDLLHLAEAAHGKPDDNLIPAVLADALDEHGHGEVASALRHFALEGGGLKWGRSQSALPSDAVGNDYPDWTEEDFEKYGYVDHAPHVQKSLLHPEIRIGSHVASPKVSYDDLLHAALDEPKLKPHIAAYLEHFGNTDGRREMATRLRSGKGTTTVSHSPHYTDMHTSGTVPDPTGAIGVHMTSVDHGQHSLHHTDTERAVRNINEPGGLRVTKLARPVAQYQSLADALQHSTSQNSKAKINAVNALIKAAEESGSAVPVVHHHPRHGFHSTVAASIAGSPYGNESIAKYLGAWAGLITQHPEFVAFEPDENGPDAVHIIKGDSPRQLADQLRAAGHDRFSLTSTAPYHAFLFDEGAKIGRFSNGSIRRGRGHSVGDRNGSGSDSRANYREAIRSIEPTASPAPEASGNPVVAAAPVKMSREFLDAAAKIVDGKARFKDWLTRYVADPHTAPFPELLEIAEANPQFFHSIKPIQKAAKMQGTGRLAFNPYKGKLHVVEGTKHVTPATYHDGGIVGYPPRFVVHAPKGIAIGVFPSGGFSIRKHNEIASRLNVPFFKKFLASAPDYYDTDEPSAERTRDLFLEHLHGEKPVKLARYIVAWKDKNHVVHKREVEAANATDAKKVHKEAQVVVEKKAPVKMSRVPKTDTHLLSVAEAYAGKPLSADASNPTIEESREWAKRYEAAKHDPTHPDVVAAYAALAEETRKQWHHLQAHGYKMEPTPRPMYKNSAEMTADVVNNKHLWYDPTSLTGFGEKDVPDHPLLALSPEGIPYNDMFRAVHDVFGHALHGHTFGRVGEERAYQDHKKMFSPLAVKALTSETKGQNSWVNAGPHSHLPVTERPYAEQKATIL